MTFNRMGTLPLPLALHLASYTALGLFCFFAFVLNMIDPEKIIPNAAAFFLIMVFSWGYVFGILMARREVVVLGVIASIAWLAAGVAGATLGFDWWLTWLFVGLGAYGLVTLGLYRKRILEH